SPTVVSATGSEAARAVLFIRAPPSLPWRLARGGGFPPTGRTNMSNVSGEQMFPVSVGYQQKWHRSPQNQWPNAPQRGEKEWSACQRCRARRSAPGGGRGDRWLAPTAALLGAGDRSVRNTLRDAGERLE